MDTSSDKVAIQERFLAVDSANVADVLDTKGYRHQGLSAELRPFGLERMAGWAYTIAGQMIPYEETGDPAKMEACQGIGEGELSVWSGHASGVCYFGELIAVGMMEQGAVGALVDGGVRDTRWLREHGFPVYARYTTPVQSIGRWRVTEWQVPVYVTGATTQWVVVRPGDFVLADDDGVVVVPCDEVIEVLEQSERLTATEQEVRRALRGGTSLQECLDQFGHV